jgi:hypothetical protein
MVRHTLGADLLDDSKNPAMTMKATGYGSMRMLMRYPHREYVHAVREAIDRRNGKTALVKFWSRGHWGRLGRVGKCLRRLEPTIGLEPMTCRLRIDCSTN